jgi:hypothetical protein
MEVVIICSSPGSISQDIRTLFDSIKSICAKIKFTFVRKNRSLSFSKVPIVDHEVCTYRDNIVASIIEACFVAVGFVALQSLLALPALGIPDLNSAVWRSTDELLARWIVAEGPNTLLMALESRLALVG